MFYPKTKARDGNSVVKPVAGNAAPLHNLVAHPGQNSASPLLSRFETEDQAPPSPEE